MARSSAIYSIFFLHVKPSFLINELQVKQSGITFPFQIRIVDLRKSYYLGVKIGMTHLLLDMLAIKPMKILHMYLSFIVGISNWTHYSSRTHFIVSLSIYA